MNTTSTPPANVTFKKVTAACLSAALLFFVSLQTMAQVIPAVHCSSTSSTTTFSNSTPTAIPTGPAVVTSTIVVSGSSTYLFDLNVTTFITHTFAADLDITLTSPAGTVVTFTTDNGAGNDNVFNGTIWDDDADADGQVPYTANNGLTTDQTYTNLTLASPLVPEEALGAFIGEDPNGTWTITISDDLADDGGSLDLWSLQVTGLAAAPSSFFDVFTSSPALAIPTGPAVVSSTITVSGLDPYLLDVNAITNITHTFAADLDITISSPAGTVVTLTTDNGAGNDNVFAGTTWDDDADPDGLVPYTSNNGLVSDQVYVNLTVATPLVPEDALAAFIGENPNGVWTITISDDLADDGGTLNSWELDITSVGDVTPPSITCGGNVTVGTDAGVCEAVVDLTGAATATDDCSTPTVTYSPASGSTFPVGTTSVLATATDAAGNTSTCSFFVVVGDDENPTAVCQDITVDLVPLDEEIYQIASLNTGGGAEITATANGPATSMGDVIVLGGTSRLINNVQVAVFNLASLAAFDLTLSIYSDCSASLGAGTACGSGPGTLIATQTLTGITLPLLATGYLIDFPFPDLDVSGEVDQTISVVLNASRNDVYWFVNCNPGIGSSTPNTTRCGSVVANNGCARNFGTTNAFYINVTATSSTYGAIISGGDIDNGSTDNCGIVDYSVSPSSFSCSDIGTNPVTLTVTDAAGNSSSCNATVTVQDVDAPVITCPADITVGNDVGDCGAVVTFSATATDNCSATITYDPASGSFFALGTTTVTATAEDLSGNTDVCTFTVTVNDTEDPTVDCIIDPVVCNTYASADVPVDILDVATVTSTLTVGGAGTLVNDINVLGLIGTHTWVGDLTVSLTSPGGTTVQLWSGLCGSSANFNINLDDEAGSGITCPLNAGNTQIPASAISAFDGEDPNGTWILTITDGFGFDVGTLTGWSLQICTGGGNVVYAVNEPGVCEAAVTVATPAFGDNCPGAVIVNDYNNTDDASDTYPVGTTTVLWTAVDLAGNSSTCTVDVVVSDTEFPVITCPGDVVQDNDAGVCGAVISYSEPVVSDNCPLPQLVAFSGPSVPILDNSLNIGIQLVSGLTGTSLGTDVFLQRVCLNVSHTWVNDVYLVLESPNGDQIDLVVQPPCAGDDLDICIVPGTGSSVNAVGSCGNSPAYSGNFTAESGDLGSLSSGTDPNGTWTLYAYDFATGDEGAVNDWTLTFEDASGIVAPTQTAGLPSGSVFPVGTTTNSFEITDASGNTSTCSFDVVISDVEAPVLSCPDVNVNNDPGLCSAIVNYTVPVGVDNCDPLQLTQSLSQTIMVGNSVACYNGGLGVTTANSYLRVFDLPALGYNDDFFINSVDVGIEQAVGGTGGSQTATLNLYSLSGPMAYANLTLLTTESVTIADQADGVLNIPLSSQFTVPAGTVLVVELATSNGVVTGDLLFVGSNNLGETGSTFLAAGDCGIIDPLTVADIGFPGMHWVLNVNAGTQTVFVSGVGTGGNFPVGSTTETYQATDLHGNVTTCSFDVIVTDTEVPTIDCGTNPPSPFTITQVSNGFENGRISNALWFNGNGISADDFTVAANTCFDVNSISANFLSDNPGSTSAMNVYFYSDASGSPGSIVSAQVLSPSDWTTTLIGNAFGIDVYRYDLTLPSTATLCGGPSGTAYWFSVQGENPVDNFYWEFSSLSQYGNNGQFNLNAGGWINNGDNFVFDLNGSSYGGLTTYSTTNDPGVCGAQVTVNPPDYEDNCPLILTNDFNGTDDASDFYPVGTTTVTWTVTDPSGNSASCVVIVVVEDTEAPVVTCPGDIFLDNDEGQCGAIVNYADITATDNCTLPNVPVLGDPTGFTGSSISIFDNTTTSGSQSVSGLGTVLGTDVVLQSICLNVTHTYVGDLAFTLESPNGDQIILMNGPGCGGDDLDVCFVTGTGNPLIGGSCGNSPAYSGDYTAESGDLAGLSVGTDPNGTWTLYATDNFFADEGAVNSWTLNFAPITGFVTATPTQTAGLPSGSEFPVGTTTNTFEITDAAGNVGTCSFDVVVSDVEGPVLECPGDIEVDNDAGVCGAEISYLVPVGADNCDPFTVTHSASQDVVSGAGIACNTGGLVNENRIARVFDVNSFGFSGGMHVTGVSFGVETAAAGSGGSQPATVNLYSLSGPLSIANLTLLATQAISIPDQTLSVMTIPMDVNVAGGTQLVFEIHIPDGTGAGNTLFIGANLNGQTGPSYIASAPCGAPDYADLALFGLPDNAFVMNVLVGSLTLQTDGTGYTSGDVFPIGTTDQEYTATDIYGNETVCSFTVTVNDVEAPVFTLCPADIIACENDEFTDYDAPIATDNCPGVTVVQTAGLPSGSDFPAGVNTVEYTATDVSGNVTICSFTVTVTPSPVADFTFFPTCIGEIIYFTSTASVDPSLGTSIASYEWEFNDGSGINTDVNPTHVYNVAGDYDVTLTVTTNWGCEYTITHTVTVDPTPEFTTTVEDALCNGESNGSITVDVTVGTTPVEYSINGGPLQSSNVFSGLAAGNYLISVTTASGCSASAAVTVGEPEELVGAVESTTDAICYGQASGAAEVSATGGTQPYSYSIDGGSSQGSGIFSGLMGGNHTVTITDDNGCTTDVTLTVGEPDEIVVDASSQPVLCNGDATGSIEVSATGGTGAYQYSADGGATFQSTGSFSGLPAGTYVVVVQDENGCSVSEGIVITEPSEALSATVEIQNVACTGDASGSVVVSASGGTGAYQYSIDGGDSWQSSNVFGQLDAGDYTITVQDANGCSFNIDVTVAEPTELLTLGTVTTSVTCNGAGDGMVELTATGGDAPYQYSINGGIIWSSSGSFTNLSPGTYTVMVQDANGCQIASFIVITQPAALTMSMTESSDASCEGADDGSFTVAAAGGTEPYTYSSDGNSNTTGVFSNATSGSHLVTVTDASGCTATVEAVVGYNNPLPVAAFNWFASGSVVQFSNQSLNGTGYSWDFGDGNTSTDQNPVHAYAAGGTYTVTLIVTNACGSDTVTWDIDTNNIGINDPNAGASVLNVYPNPNHGEFTLSFTSTGIIGDIQVNIMTVEGKLVMAEQYTVNATAFIKNYSDVQLAAGVYIVQFTSQYTTEVKRITVDR